MTISIGSDDRYLTAQPRPLLRATGGFVALAIILWFFADIEVTTQNPWTEVTRMLTGAITPDFFQTEGLVRAVVNTVAFAVLGVALGNFWGFLLALVFHFRLVRVGCAFIRSVHELFWALIFLQVFGLSALTGVLALAIPYAGIFAKVYSEILEEVCMRHGLYKALPLHASAPRAQEALRHSQAQSIKRSRGHRRRRRS